MRIDLRYGHTLQTVELPAELLLGIFAPPQAPPTTDSAALVREALQHPIASPPLRQIVAGARHVALVTSDLTRPCPSDLILPTLIDALNEAGVPDAAIEIIIGLGLHRPMTPEELHRHLGVGITQRVRVVNHDPGDVISLGTTSYGTPVELYRPLVEADRRICLGAIEFHYFAGFSGGAKAILPGCASSATIRANHAMMTHPHARAAILEDNPVRRDLEEGAAMAGVDFILNVLVDANHHITGVVAGHAHHAHRAGCERVLQRGSIPMPTPADIVLVSAGGYPKDINLYQAQKALDNAAGAVREGGAIILVAECAEGFGNATFEEWLLSAGSPDELLARIRREFVLGGHKAAAIASVLRRAHVWIVSSLPAERLQCAGLRSASHATEALRAAWDLLGPEARVAVFPEGGSVLPRLVCPG